MRTMTATRRIRRTAMAVAIASIGAVALGACSSGAASDVADTIATKAVATYAEGRWHCETDQVENGSSQHLTTTLAIRRDGRFSYEVADGNDGPLAGTWSIDGLELHLSIPWQDDGRNGFSRWIYEADADPPSHLDGREPEGNGEQDLDVDVTEDRVTIHQDDDPGIGGVNYAWDVTCDRTSDDPGTIPPTIPATPAG